MRRDVINESFDYKDIKIDIAVLEHKSLVVDGVTYVISIVIATGISSLTTLLFTYIVQKMKKTFKAEDTLLFMIKDKNGYTGFDIVSKVKEFDADKCESHIKIVNNNFSNLEGCTIYLHSNQVGKIDPNFEVYDIDKTGKLKKVKYR